MGDHFDGQWREIGKFRRRRFLIAAGLLLATPLARAQARSSPTLPRIGILQAGSPSAPSRLLEAFQRGLRELGYVEGRTIVLEYRWADGKLGELPRLANELVRTRVDVIFAAVAPAAVAAKNATNAIPIVFAQVNDPVGIGLVSSLARPDGNITGVTTNNLELVGKRIELLREVTPRGVSRVAILFNPADVSNVLALKETERVTRVLGMTLVTLPVRGPEELAGAFATLTSERVHAFWVAAGTFTNTHASRIVELAGAAKVPAVYGSGEFTDAGGLMAYSAVFGDSYRRAATYVDKILKGAKPGDLPVEQLNKYELVVNLSTAKALGLKIPQSILLRADRVIE